MAILLGTAGTVQAQETAASPLERAWIRVVQALDPLDLGTVHERVDELLDVASRLEVVRLTPMATGLQLRSRTLTDAEAETLLAEALRLDPGSPDVELERAQRRLRRGAVASGVTSLFRAVVLACRDTRMASAVRGSLLLAAMLGLAILFLAWSVMAVRRVLPRLWHDLCELGFRWRLDRNTPVMAALLLFLPVFLALDPMWLGLWLLALAWAYLPGGQKAVSAVGLALIALAPFLVELGFRELTRPTNPIVDGANALQELRYRPESQLELAELGFVFSGDPEFHRLRGDVFRQAGLLDSAATAYSDGLRLAPGEGRLSVALGVVRYLQKDFNSAVQAFSTARNSGTDPVVTNYNLSLAFAQTYLFRESDEAMAAARGADPLRFRTLTWGRDHLPLAPVFGSEDAKALIARHDPVDLLTRGILPPPLAHGNTLWQPVTIGALAALLVALGHFLIRERRTGFSGACLKCGRAFCSRCKLSTESQSYCTQCINIFLKKDMVAIETQVAKRRQLGHRHLLLRLERRAADALLPGLGLTFAGRPRYGFLFMAVALVVGVLGLIWLPFFAAPALVQASPGSVVLVPVTAWILLIAAAQSIPSPRR